MLCDECKKKTACVHVTKICNNQKFEKHLCEQCAKETGEMNICVDMKLSVHDFLKGMFKHCIIDESQQQAIEAPCPNCGMTYGDFSRNGKIGCSTCYTIFSEQIEPLVRRIHGASIHTGKIPRRAGSKIEAKIKLKQLRQELERFVEREEYEKAAVLRDEIRAREKDAEVVGGDCK